MALLKQFNHAGNAGAILNTREEPLGPKSCPSAPAPPPLSIGTLTQTMQPGPVPGYPTHAEPRERRCCTSVRGLRVVCMRYTMTTLIHKSADLRRWWWPYTRVLGQVAAAQRGVYLFRQRTGGSLRPEHRVGRAPGGGHLAHVEHGTVRWWFRSRTTSDLWT